MFLDRIMRGQKKDAPAPKQKTQNPVAPIHKEATRRNSEPKTAQEGSQSAQQSKQPVKSAQNDRSSAKGASRYPKKPHGSKTVAGKGGKRSQKNRPRSNNRNRYKQVEKRREMNVLNPHIEQKNPSLPEKTLRIIPIGGNEEVGRNMNVFEYGDDIVIVDMGVQFPEEDMPGIDYIIPNISYLKGKEKNIRGVIFTHGHLDHIGAAAILLEKLNYPPIIGRDLTVALIKRRLEDHQRGSASRLQVIRVGDHPKPVRLGAFTANFFQVEHSIVDSMGVALESPEGTILHLGDWMLNHDPASGKTVGYDHLAHVKRPSILMLESLGADKFRDPVSEKDVHHQLEKMIDDAPGRLIIGTFASQVRRIIYLIEYAAKRGKKVVINGYSMKTNIDVAKELGYLKVNNDEIVPVEEMHKYPDNKIVIIGTGAQGENNAMLNKIVLGEHKYIKLTKSDTIVFSSSIIPGNERTVQRLKDNLYRKCDNVVHSSVMDVHIGGHSTADDIKTVLRQIKPNYFLPIYANHFFLKESAKRAMEISYPEQSIYILDNGNVFDLNNGGAKVLKEKVDTSYVFVDGLGVGDIGHVVLRDRQMLAEDGMFAITVIIDSRSKRVVGNIQITSRGFIYVKDNFDLINETKKKVESIIKNSTSKGTSIDWKFVENNIRETIGQFLFQKTERRPMVLPVVIEV